MWPCWWVGKTRRKDLMKYKIRLVITDLLDDTITNEGKGYTKEEATNMILELPICFDYVGLEEMEIQGGIYFE